MKVFLISCLITLCAIIAVYVSYVAMVNAAIKDAQIASYVRAVNGAAINAKEASNEKLFRSELEFAEYAKSLSAQHNSLSTACFFYAIINVFLSSIICVCTFRFSHRTRSHLINTARG